MNNNKINYKEIKIKFLNISFNKLMKSKNMKKFNQSQRKLYNVQFINYYYRILIKIIV